jgi:hypothetical protein
VASEGALIPLYLLVNGVSVAQHEMEAVEYWHVELDAHDVIFAEGLPAESYLDTGNRAAFANGADFIEAHPDFQPKHWAATCLPLALEGPAVTATKARLLARLSERGCATTREADAHVCVDGVRVEPIRLGASRLAFMLPSGGRRIELRSRAFIPARILADSSDLRALGLCVGALEIDGSPQALDDDEALPGWREPEFAEGGFSHRWTTGASPLPAGARFVIVDLVGEGRYWDAAGESVDLGGIEPASPETSSASRSSAAT